ncbi:MFS transporter [Salinibacillus aidingensis]|uniref:MFS transporter n=1 Tax=Salinibacillus aidingensis TaxID=237684 RepID=UPI0031DBD7CD
MWTLFKNGNFTRLFIGRLITNAGDSLYAVAAMWLVHQLGGSTFHTGLAGFLTMLPTSLQFLVGPLVDRWELKKTLIVTQVIELLFILLIPVFYYAGILNVTVVLVVMPIVAFASQFSFPAERAALPSILEPDELVKGNSAFSFAYQGLDLVFSGLAGILVAMFGAVTLYLIDSLTFAIAVLLFATLQFPGKQKTHEPKMSVRENVKKYGRDLKEGFRFVMGSIIAKFFIGAVGANFTFGAAMAVLPAYADVRGDASFYGYMMAALSGGFLVGALLSPYAEKFSFGKMGIAAYSLSAFSWVASVFVPWNILSIMLFGAATIPIGVTEVLLAAVIQRIVPQRLLARTFSVMTSVSTSAMPLGALIGGAVGAKIGSVATFGAAAFGILLVSVVWFLVKDLRELPKSNEIDPGKYGLSEQNEAGV